MYIYLNIDYLDNIEYTFNRPSYSLQSEETMRMVGQA